jgi:hypothetical protein
MRSVEVSSDARTGAPASDRGVFEGLVARVVGSRGYRECEGSPRRTESERRRVAPNVPSKCWSLP